MLGIIEPARRKFSATLAGMQWHPNIKIRCDRYTSAP